MITSSRAFRVAVDEREITMAWGKSEEEKQAEREAKEAREREQQAWQASQQAAAAQVAQDAAFAASPVGRATVALQRGDRFFQAELLVSELTGDTSFFGSSQNQITSSGVAPDILGQIEAVGWHLEHVGYVFIETGSTSTARVLQTGEGMVTQGNVTGIYLFRRTA